MRFNDEQLSAILSAHEAGEMERGGSAEAIGVCLFEAAYGLEIFFEVVSDVKYGYVHTQILKDFDQDGISEVIEWFDTTYDASWTSEEFLRRLEERGLA